ncbi:hypothetical protein LCGC14_0777690 [marine sediment metagenome]|uniref:Uncharacterized protein n=1 Tax=marine sediment metagenome TaxID=412755 RepID=A0A0F9PWM2_9ZZZZ
MEIIKGLFAEGGPFRVRSIIAFVVVGVYAYLALTNKIPAEDILTVTLLIVGFYFITRAARGS